MPDGREVGDIRHVIGEELKAISAKRRKVNPEDGPGRRDNLFGIALSGGGIRSATVNLGVLKILNKCGILPRADYVSTVSGGGYTGGYVHAKLKGCSDKKSFDTLFPKEDLEHFEKYGFYLAPGTGLRRALRNLRLWGAFFFSLLMNWIWIISLFFTLFFLLRGIFGLVGEDGWDSIWLFVGYAAAVVLFVHFFLHGLRSLRLWSSNVLNYIEGILLLPLIFFCIYKALSWYPTYHSWENFTASLLVFFATGFFANPNILTMHRFYRDRVADAFLKAAGRKSAYLKLRELNPGNEPDDWGCAPYPLINTCLNLLGREDKSFKGTKISDYFLLSPFYCGSQRTQYAETMSPGYRNMTLATAIAVSGAAVNPNMGTRTNKILSFLMTLLNLKLGYWPPNPKVKIPALFLFIPWWPYFLIQELLSKTNTKRWRVNVSDGGHIENLGVYELLRRKCRLIIAIDASADPDYTFPDLKNLVIRARNELGIALTFRDGLGPEECIRPSPSRGFSDSHFVVADIENLPGERKQEREYSGLLVYLKSSLRAPKRFKTVASDSFLYKNSHPQFPHESTADQFFDEAQWRAYYNLGRFMAGDLLRVDVTKEEQSPNMKCGMQTIDQLIGMFDKIKKRDDLDTHLVYMDDQPRGDQVAQ